MRDWRCQRGGAAGRWGVTLVELLLVLVAMSVLSAVGYVGYRNVREHAREEKLRRDVGDLNAAVALYLANGGRFAGGETVGEVLRKLKAAAAGSAEQRLSGALVDARLRAVLQTEAEAATGELRALWDGGGERPGFVLVRGGGVGVREFVLGEPEVVEAEERSTGFALGTTEQGWIWDFTAGGEGGVGEGGATPPVGDGEQPVVATTPTQQLRRLARPVFTPVGGVYEVSIFHQTFNVTITNPNGRGVLHYSLPGQSNMTTAATVEVSIARGASVPITAWVVSDDPARWLNSEVAAETFIIISQIPESADPATVGAIVGTGDINGTFVGSLIFSNPSGNLIFNSNGRILGGNLYLPGTPRIEVLPAPGLVVDYGQSFVEGSVTIPRDVIGGKEFTVDGRLVSDAPGPQIVDLTGDETPSNYLLRFNANAYLEGRLYRRANAPTLPTVTLPMLPSRGSVNVGGNTITLQGGDYTEVKMNNKDGVLRLGDPNSSTPVEYIFRSSMFNNGRVEILGPVKVYFTNGFSVKSGFTFGNDTRPEDLQIFVSSGSVALQAGGLLSTRLVAPSSDVDLRGTFRGTLIARTLSVLGNGVVFTLPPTIAQ